MVDWIKAATFEMAEKHQKFRKCWLFMIVGGDVYHDQLMVFPASNDVSRSAKGKQDCLINSLVCYMLPSDSAIAPLEQLFLGKINVICL